jgi:hypothetical protein
VVAHVVLFRPRRDLDAADAGLLIEAFDRALRTIPTIRRVRVGRRTRIGAQYERVPQPDMPYVAVLEFDDVAGLKAYLDHPEHAEVGQRFFTSAEQTLVFDFEMQGSAEGLRALLETSNRRLFPPP